MSYKLYGCRRSGSLIVELALAEIGAGYEIEEIDLEVDAQREGSYESVNPNRKIPALETPQGELLTESAAILLTLDERHPEAHLFPAPGSTERAKVLQVLLFVATELYPIVEINDYPERFSVTPESTQEVREIARRIWRQRWLLVEAFVLGDPYLLQSGFSATDIYIAVVSRWAQQDAWRQAHTPRIERLTAAVSARPKAAPVWDRHRPDTTPARFDS